MPKELGTYLVQLSNHITEKKITELFFKLAKVVFHEASEVYNFS
jgi:hypothetical protein